MPLTIVSPTHLKIHPIRFLLSKGSTLCLMWRASCWSYGTIPMTAAGEKSPSKDRDERVYLARAPKQKDTFCGHKVNLERESYGMVCKYLGSKIE